MDKITASVGRGGHNRRDDVMTVQRLINAHLLVPLAPLKVDGVCGPKTIFAIGEYQRRHLRMNPQDCRVDPGDTTFRSLTGSTQPHKVSAPPAPTPTGTDRVRQAMNYFVGQGWTAAQAAGIVANLQAESGLQPDATGDGGLAYGLAQWHPDRQANFQSSIGWGIRGSSFADQLRFVQFELTTGGEAGAGNLLRGAAGAYDAGATISRNYERPADREGEATRRGRRAEQILNNHKSQTH